MKNRKKIRGWPRQIKKLNKYALETLLPNLNQYDFYGHTYCRFFLDPWYRLIKRNPPVWFFKLMIIHLNDAFDKWENFFTVRDKPFDLQIWLYVKTFISSELNCAKVDNFGEERELFSPSSVQKPFPEQIFGIEIGKNLEWRLCDDLGYFEEEDLLALYGSQERISAKKYTQHFRADGSKYYTCKIGEVWVGRRGFKAL